MKQELDYKDQLTNEKLLKRFNNQFELVRYAIQLAENTIRSGREPDVWTDSQNVSFMILAEIASNKEEFAEISEEQKATFPRHQESNQSQSQSQSWGDEVRALKEDKKERKTSKSKAKAAK
ncbi:MAG: hypothetical protein LLF94_10655 [Chlamydiales bacterium]|nr:hypothetical protein [Chlamydiales bacterium]